MGDDRLNSHETITKIDGLTLEDSNLDGTSIHKIDNSIQEYNIHDSEQLEDSRSRSYPTDNVSNTVSSIFEVKESSTQGDSTKQSQEKKPVKRKPTVRAKVPFEKGYSQMDWLKLTRTAPDLAGLKGLSNRRLISIDEVRQHKTEGSVWTVLKGCVFNISPYMKFHPGGEDMLMKAAGKDCTSLFNKYHAWVNAEFLLEKCLVGVLDASEQGISANS